MYLFCIHTILHLIKLIKLHVKFEDGVLEQFLLSNGRGHSLHRPHVMAKAIDVYASNSPSSFLILLISLKQFMIGRVKHVVYVHVLCYITFLYLK